MKSAHQFLSLTIVLTLTITPSLVVVKASPNTNLHQTRKVLGETKLHEFKEKTQSSSCWSEAVSKLNSTCKQLTDIQQSRLAVAFANCHLGKSGRDTYYCNDTMTVQECTGGMDSVAFQTYTEFFTHTGHICYFLQNELWQERTENTISKLSDTSSEAVVKLEEALDYHRELDQKQNQALDNQAAILDQDRRIASSLDDTRRSMDASFGEMNEMAQKQKMILTEMFGSLQDSVEGVRYLMSLFLIEFVGYETFAVFVVSCLVILFLPQFGYSRFKLYLLLFVELILEILVRRLYGYFVLWGGSGTGTKPPPESLETLHSSLWWCRYIAFFLSLILYLWEWLTYRDHTLLLNDIQQNTDLIMERLGIESPTSKKRSSVPTNMQGGPPPPGGDTPVRHSWPLIGRLVKSARDKEVPQESQPSELTSRELPPINEEAADSVDGCVFSKRNLGRDGSRPQPIPRGDRRSAYHFDPIPGLQPPVGHPRSPYTDKRISDYIASLPAEFDTTGEQSFMSTTAVPPDSDTDKSLDGSNDTFTFSENENPYVRPPMKTSPNTKPSSKSKNKNAAGPSNPRLSGGRGSGLTGRRIIPTNDLLNISVTNRPDEGGSEKEVAEEKKTRGTPRMSSTPRSLTRQTGRSRLTEPVTSLTPIVTTPTSTRRRTMQSSTPNIQETPRRYNLRSRTPKQTPTNK